MNCLTLIALAVVSLADIKSSADAAGYKLLKSNHQCSSSDITLDSHLWWNVTQKCADLCKKISKYVSSQVLF